MKLLKAITNIIAIEIAQLFLFFRYYKGVDVILKQVRKNLDYMYGGNEND